MTEPHTPPVVVGDLSTNEGVTIISIGDAYEDDASALVVGKVASL
jgi:hypothetical protein